MEARSRLQVLCSHLRPTRFQRRSVDFPFVSASNCAGKVGEQSIGEELGKEHEESDCVFCKIVRGESPAFKLYEDDVCICILDVNPLNHGHSLIIPKSHYSSLEVTPPSVVASMCSKIPFVSNAIMKATNCDSFNLVVNSGTAAGQVVFHTHLHIIPRNALDHLWKSMSFKRIPLNLDQDTTQLVDRIREQLKLLDENCEDIKTGE